MSLIIKALLFLFTSQSLVTVCLAANPYYEVPGIFENRTVSNPSKVCENSNYSVIGDGDILVEDCEAILKEWQTTYFAVDLYEWTNATTSQPYLRLASQGTCEIAIKRLGGADDSLNDLLTIGDQDLKDLVNTSIELARFGDGSKIKSVEGSMNCTNPSSSHDGVIDWILGKTDDINEW